MRRADMVFEAVIKLCGKQLREKGRVSGVTALEIARDLQRFFMERDMFIKMPPKVPPLVARSFAALTPGFVILFAVWAVNTALIKSVNLALPEAINNVIGIPVMNLGSSLPATLIAIIVIQLLWCVGIQGRISF